ncbi:MAG: hypothetical protein WCT23_05600, partial [Candidatus Neomarinimicrobiota bacterium]
MPFLDGIIFSSLKSKSIISRKKSSLPKQGKDAASSIAPTIRSYGEQASSYLLIFLSSYLLIFLSSYLLIFLSSYL